MITTRDDDVFDDRGLLRDGKTYRVPLILRDADTLSPVQREVLADVAMRDAALHRPGPRFCTDAAANDAKAQAYAESVEELTTAWQRKPVDSESGFGSGEFRGQQPGDVCTINGQPGHLNHRLECVPDRQHDSVPRMMDAATAQAIRDEAWLASVEADENAWRGPVR
jgi:hypothetical protein